MMVWPRSRTKALTTHPMSSLLPTTMIQSCARPSRTLKLTRWLLIKKRKSLRYTSREAPRPFSLRSKAVMKKTWMIKRLSWPRSSSIRLSNSLPSCTKKFPIFRPWSHLVNLPTYRSWKSARFSSSLIAFQTSSRLNDRRVARQSEIKQNLTHTKRNFPDFVNCETCFQIHPLPFTEQSKHDNQHIWLSLRISDVCSASIIFVNYHTPTRSVSLFTHHHSV